MMYKILTFFLITFFCSSSFSQTDNIDQFRPDAEKEKKYMKYVAVGHGGLENIESWKNSNTVLYYKELWYYAESFYIKRNYLEQGESLDESIIDVSRWENQRDATVEKIIILPGYRDVMVLLPKNKLKFRPDK